MNYRLTYAFNRDELSTVIFPAKDVEEALKKAFVYIEAEHGEGSFNKLVGIALIEHVNTKEDVVCEQE